MPTPLRSLVLVLGLAGATGCSSSCPREEEPSPRPFSAGTTSAERSYYETAAFGGEFLDFPAGRRWSIEHGLGVVPGQITTYLAASARPFATREGNVTESAGNQVRIDRVDATRIEVRNDTCEHFYLRLVATAGASSGGEGGEGGGS